MSAERVPVARSFDVTTRDIVWTQPQDPETAPEVAEVLTRMPSWASRGLLYIIVGFLVTALLWAHFSVIDIVVEARGDLTPEGYVRPVQAAQSGVVQMVRVREGDRVAQGQRMLQLDTIEPTIRLNKLREELATDQEQLQQLQATNGSFVDILEQRNRLAELQRQMATAQRTLDHAILTAPVGGIVTRLDVHGAGAYVQSGQTVAMIAPAGARLVLTSQVPNRDIAFVAPGLPVKIKFDAFPFEDYGSVPGVVIEVAPDAQTEEQQGSSYKVTIAPLRTVVTARGRAIPLRPGLAATAEIVTEHKDILSLFLEPFRTLKGKTESVP